MSLTMIHGGLYTASQCGEIDHRAINDLDYSGLGLMELAGSVAAQAIIDRYLNTETAIVLCGPGNNGGDGYVIARELKKAGKTVSVIAPVEPVTPDAITSRKKLQEHGEIPIFESIAQIAPADIRVDAMFGAGLARELSGIWAQLVEWVNLSAGQTVAIDVPSGLNANTGLAFSPAVNADLTITFIGDKLGLHTGDGTSLCGELVFDRLGLGDEAYCGIEPVATQLQPPVRTVRARNSHKSSYGSLAILGGDIGMPGAVILAGRAALRAGSGLVRILSRERHLGLSTMVQPELMSASLESPEEAKLNVDAATAIVAGPGTLDNDWCYLLLDLALSSGKPVVLDAGALRVLGRHPMASAQRVAPLVLTPHPGEAAAMLDTTTESVQSDRLAATHRIANEYRAICVLKGAGTVISDGQQATVCTAGNPGMATAGTGDVLAGMIGARLASGIDVWDAVTSAVWLHAAAGDRAASKLGEEALIASDLVDALRYVMR